jgi:hypothetical protein
MDDLLLYQRVPADITIAERTRLDVWRAMLRRPRSNSICAIWPRTSSASPEGLEEVASG